jgi:hypothetical protein
LEALAVARDLIAAGDVGTMLVVATDLAGAASSELLKAAVGPAPLPEGACAALLGAFPARQARSGAQRDVEVPADVPRTLGPDADWIWTGPAGHIELHRYLSSL